jgi:hypothetical protein
MPNTSKQAILVLTDKSSPIIINLYSEIKKATKNHSDVLIAFHQKEPTVPEPIKKADHFLFDNTVLTNLGFRPISDKLLPGSNHFPLLKFYRENPEYEYYWIIEDDVRFSGNWSLLFDSLSTVNSDFISCSIRNWNEEPGWCWWDLTHPTKELALEKRVASFNPVYRISNRALKFINNALLDGWSGHHEVLYPSLLKNGGFLIADFGGEGSYVIPGFENKVYLADRPDQFKFGYLSTMKFRPVFNMIGKIPNKFYHPVKDFGSDYTLFNETSEQREYWLRQMDKISRPVIQNLAEGSLKEKMPVVVSKETDNAEARKQMAYMEAFGRTLSGIAPWLNIEGGSASEIDMRNQYRAMTLKAISNAVNPDSNDYMVWTGSQFLVDNAYFALGLIRCPWLWENLDETTKKNTIKAFRIAKGVLPINNHRILFPALIEAFFCKYGLPFDPVRIEYGIREFANHWNVGDGMFSDGEQFQVDYYNSIVTHPFLANILLATLERYPFFDWFSTKLNQINKRYAEILERTINSDGSFAATGRSITYRGGAFHHLSDISLRKQLPATLKPAQVRDALTAVITKTLEPPSTFTADGWLNIGLYGHQPDLAESYITTGSLYMCTNIFLPLGLPCSDEFWVSPAQEWSSRILWSGQNMMKDEPLEVQLH